jgi:hypothetical protein
MTVGKLLATMSSSEFSEWGAYLEMKHQEQEKASKEAAAKARGRR